MLDTVQSTLANLVCPAGSFVVVYEAVAFMWSYWQEGEGRSEPSCCSWNWNHLFMVTFLELIKPIVMHALREKRFYKIRKYSESIIKCYLCTIPQILDRFLTLGFGNNRGIVSFTQLNQKILMLFFFFFKEVQLVNVLTATNSVVSFSFLINYFSVP